ncbi:MAG TPA: Fe-Mn family superoxide dismutase [Myxococcota bacterium]|nr:Fe-Mn family superoxide dismutase [Myxococcota bacterium]
MNFDLAPLPYPESGLEPHIGRTTLAIHLTTSDADLPMVYRATALLSADLWEHLDHSADRGSYLQVFFDHLIDWDFAAANWHEIAQRPLRSRVARPARSAWSRRVG